MIAARRFGRWLFSRIFVSMMGAMTPYAKPLDPKRLRAQMGGHDTLHIVAAGASVTRSKDAEGVLIDSDVLGVNYFITCDDVPLWAETNLFVIEPHETYPAYAKALSRAAASKGRCHVIVKGIGSPGKIKSSLQLVRSLGKPGVTALLARDFYMTDLEHVRPADAIIAHPEQTVSGFKTLLWVLSFAYVAGYRQIVLHGFDFSQDYAYSSTGNAEDAPIPQNTWVNDEANRASMLSEVARLKHLFAERGIQLTHSGCDGPLATILPAFGEGHGPGEAGA